MAVGNTCISTGLSCEKVTVALTCTQSTSGSNEVLVVFLLLLSLVFKRADYNAQFLSDCWQLLLRFSLGVYDHSAPCKDTNTDQSIVPNTHLILSSIDYCYTCVIAVTLVYWTTHTCHVEWDLNLKRIQERFTTSDLIVRLYWQGTSCNSNSVCDT